MKKVLLIILLFLVGGSVFAQKGVMTPELLWKLKRVGGVQVSPQEDRFFYKVSEYDVTKNSGTSKYKLMKVDGSELQMPEYLSTSRLLAWTKDGELFIERAGKLELYNFETNKSHILLDHQEDGWSGFELSPDLKSLLFIKNVKLDNSVNDTYKDLPKANARIVDDLMYRHWDSWHDYKYSHVFVIQSVNGKFEASNAIDIMKGEKFDAPLNPFGGMEQISFSADSKSIFYTCKKLSGKAYAQSTNSQIYKFDLDSKNTSCITEGYEGYDMQPVFDVKGNYAWLSMRQNGFESDKNDIVYRDLKNKTTVNLTKDIDLTISDFVFGAKGKKIYFKSVIEATYQLFELDIASKKIRQITEGQHNYTSIALAGKKMIGTRQDMNHPNEVFSVDIKSGSQVQLTNENKLIFDELELCKIDKRWVETSDGKKMLTWVIYPPNFDETKKYPTLLYCQGGPQSAVSQFYSFRWNFQLMASKGYIVVAPNRRGLPGFGQEWNDAISKDWGGQPMEDYLSAIDELSKEDYVDENNLGAVGASYGGYSVYYLAGIHNKRFKAFISHCGLFNLESWYGTTEELFFANWDIGGPYWKQENKELYIKNSPHKNVDKWDTPILVIHGGKDFRVPLSEGMQAFQAAQLQGVPSKFLYFPEESHWVLSPQNGLVWHREFFSWLDNWLKK